MDRQHSESSGEALDKTISELYETALRLQELRAVMGHIAFGGFRPQDKGELRHAAEVFLRLGKQLDSQAGTLPEKLPAPPDDDLYDALVGPEYWERRLLEQPADELLEIKVLEDDAVRIRGRRVQLDREQRFVVSRLLVEPHPLTTQSLQQRMRTPEGEAYPIEHIRNVLSGLHLLFDASILSRVHGGRGLQYILQPGVGVRDERLRPDDAPPLDVAVITPLGVMEVNGDFFRRPYSVAADREQLSIEAVNEIGDEPEEPGPEGYPWSDAQDIARFSGMTLTAAQYFIQRNSSKIGKDFLSSELRRRPANNGEESKLTRHYSPQFVAWAVASLRLARARYVALAQDVTD